MCGILGGNKSSWNYKKAVLSMKHRGPDGQKMVQFPEVTLGFARLSVIDLSEHGMQPMFSGDEEVCIVFNGEIYGYQEIRHRLEKLGHRFHSKTDTEVIINSYLEYGDQFIDHIDGMFAFAIYDRRTGKLKLYRDRAGIKPLYYYWDGRNFAFASELKTIVSLCNDIRFEIDYTAIYDYLTYTYIPEPKTMYKNVFKLDKGHTLAFDVPGRRLSRPRKYWEVIPNTAQGPQRKKKDVEEQIRHLIGKSVKEQMVADVPVGCFLSGGIDSSVVTREAIKHNSRIETFSIGFTDSRFDELKYAELMSDTFSIRKNQKVLDFKGFQELYPLLADWYDEPYCDTSAFPTYLVSRLAKEKVTVVLTGDGGDELFGGYQRYQAFLDHNMDQGLNSRLLSGTYEFIASLRKQSYWPKLDALLLEDVAKISPLYGYNQKRTKTRYAKEWGIDNSYDDYWYFRKYYRKELPPITRLQYLDFNTYLPSDILTKVDRASMQVSLETRIPLLSRELMEFAFGLSERDRCPGGQLKGALKAAYRGFIPEEILDRRKMGFGIPDNYIKREVSQQEKLLKDIWKI